MVTPRDSKRLLFFSLAALVLTIGGMFAGGYAWLSNRATRWGDHLIIGPRFSGDIVLNGGATRVRLWREDGVPVLDAPSWNRRGPFYVTFVGGFAIYHTPPGTLR